MKNLSFYKKINIFIWAILLVGSMSFAVVGAVTMFGREYHIGYFDAKFDDWGDAVFAEGIPDADVTPNNLVYTLQTVYYKNGTARQKTGAAFIANTIMDQNGSSASRTIPDSGTAVVTWAKVLARLQSFDDAGLIEWHHSIPCSETKAINSYYQGTGAGTNPNDDAYYFDKDCGENQIDTIYIKNADNTTAYILKYECGNPVGEVNMKDWSITPTATVQPTATPNTTVTWNHGVTVVGSGPTNQSVAYSYENRSGFSSGGGVGADSPLDSPAAPGTNRPFTSSYNVTDADVGKEFCRRTVANPGYENGPAVYSADACVTIVSGVAAGACRPITITAKDSNWDGTKGLIYTKNTRYNTKGGGETIRVYVKIYKLDSSGNITGNAVFSKTVSNGDPINDRILTTSCTTGDKYQVNYSTSSYSYSAGPSTTRHYNTGCPDNCVSHTYYTYAGLKRTDSWTQQIGPCYDYLLKSSISALSDYQVEVGSSITVTPSMASESWTYNNLRSFWNTYRTGLHTKSKTSEWQINKIVIPKNTSVPSVPAGTSTSAPCPYYNSKGLRDCTLMSSGTNTVFSNANAPTVLSGTKPVPVPFTVGDIDAGKKVCFVFSVRAADSEGAAGTNNESATASNSWYHSALFPNLTNNTNPTNYCVIVVKKPKVQVLGGDVKVGRGFSGINSFVSSSHILTINSVKSNVTFGSWAEYALAAPGKIVGMASGSAFANTGMTNATPCKYSTLSFSNTDNNFNCNSNTIGSYSFGKKTIPDISTSFPLSSVSSAKLSGNNVKLDNLASGSYTTNGNISIVASDIAAGHWVVINAPAATVTIVGDIKYTDGKINGIDKIPQVVIIAKDILISNNVHRVDSWLVAKGELNTCAENKSGNLSVNDCSAQLIVNGPVMAAKISLRRTAGSGRDAASGEPAEIFNLRADAYLWSYARASGTGRVWTVYTTNVPPRL